MRWLHLSDLHVGRDDAAQSAALASLFEAIVAAAEEKVFDCVLLTGDLAWSGLSSEYDALNEALLAPLRSHMSCKTSHFIATPGNHDLDCEGALPVDWASLGKERQALFFQNSDKGRKLRTARTNGFAAYSKFLKDRNVLGVDPLSHCASNVEVTVSGVGYNFLCVNTALFSDKVRSDEGTAPAPTLAIRLAINAAAGRTTFVVAHHPVEWFMHATQEPLKSLLETTGSVYVHGHTHEIMVRFGQRGVRSLGFGAAKLANLDSQPDGVYKNTFAICEVVGGELHVAFRGWDAAHGLWRPETSVPVEFGDPSTRLRSGFQIPVPFALHGSAPHQRSVARAEAPISVVGSLDVIRPAEWVRFLVGIAVLPLGSPPRELPGAPPGEYLFVFTDSRGTHRIRCISGRGHVLSALEVENENTRLDMDGHASSTIISFGTLAEDGRAIAQKLSLRKPIQIICEEDLRRRIATHLPLDLAAVLRGFDPAATRLGYFMAGDSPVLAVEDRISSSWFYLLDVNGRTLGAADSRVRAFRTMVPALESAAYGAASSSPSRAVEPINSPIEPFDRAEYLEKSFCEFDEIKYAPLASVGVRFPKAKLHDLYVPAKADMTQSPEQSETVRQIVNDMLDAMQLDDAQRSQMEGQLREYFGGKVTRLSGEARGLYQKQGAVLVLGDPGSGKTCFAKNEVLAYCRPNDSGAWYGFHTPVFVPLADLAGLLGQEKISADALLSAVVVLVERRGLRLSEKHLHGLVASGRAAFFFDGLDEVASVEHRAQIVEAIKALMEGTQAHGNRFVLTSRPAAIQLIETPKQMHTLRLVGLSDDEIRTLATRLLRFELAPGGEQVRDTSELSPENANLVDRLVENCRSNPGIRRIARNPLLLTLLVTIYANHGPLAAKRHRVYAQAVQTLVSVRNRAAASLVLSEADLRRRLGRVAIEVIKDAALEVPSHATVSSLIEKAMREEGTRSDRGAAGTFIQTVAEATGLLVIHQAGHAGGTPTVSFMHYSFLEYYAAIGFIDEDPAMSRVPTLAKQPRWREILTLVAGIVGDHGDITPVVTSVLAQGTAADAVTLENLIFAFDCALECDVPPEASQAALMGAVKAAVLSGPARVDPTAREELADRVARLIVACGSPLAQAILAEGAQTADVVARGAFVDLVGRVYRDIDIPSRIRDAISAGVKDGEPQLIVALLTAAERAPLLRDLITEKDVTDALRGSVPVRYAATRFVEAVPAIARVVETALKEAVEDPQPHVAAAASRAVLEGGLVSTSDAGFFEKCLRRWEESTRTGVAATIQLRADRQHIDGILSSPDKQQRVLGLRLLPWLVREERFVYDRLFEALRAAKSREEVVAALASLRLTPNAIALATLADVDLVAQILRTSDARDVRIAACRALAVFPSDQAVVESLRAYAEGCKQREFVEALRAVLVHARTNTNARMYIYSKAEVRLRGAADGNFGSDMRQKDLRKIIGACEELGWPGGPEPLLALMQTVADSYKTPEEIRRQCVRAYARMADPSTKTIDQMIRWLHASGDTFKPIIGAAVQDHVVACRQKVEFVRTVYPKLAGLLDALLVEWKKWSPANSRQFDHRGYRGLRAAVKEVDSLLVGYQEFAAVRRL